MSYQEDIVIGKLSALNETQEGIVGVAQWILFHRYCHLAEPRDECLSHTTSTDAMQSGLRTFGCNASRNLRLTSV